ncbi:MAG: hypothetical protein A2075_13280, partial [Geobacteraceae bacterium GWC2_58_44]
MAIKSDGSLWAWGSNDEGELGIGSTIAKSSPNRVGSATDWKLVAGGLNYTLAIKNDGSLWAWGANYNGRLGDGTTNGRSTPTRIGDGNDWKLAAAGEYHNAAIKSDGSLWTWGSNYSSQLGDGTTYDQYAPTRIGNANDWKQVAAGGAHSVAIRNDGSLWAWGNNFSGQLGDGTTTSKANPTRIGTATNWKTVSAGSFHTMAVKSDGSLWGWGNNFTGQLGDGGDGITSTPVRIGAAKDWQDLLAGADSSFGVRESGSLWAWGSNWSGKLGDGSSADQGSPILVLAGEAADTTSPVVGIFTMPGATAAATVPITGFAASDDVGVTEYCVSEAGTPAPCNWSATKPANYTFTSSGWKTVYAWAADRAGNVSLRASASVTATDATAPAVTAFAIPASWQSPHVPITALSASDDFAVGGLCVSESNSATGCDWSSAAATLHSFAGVAAGTPAVKTLYAFARDLSGNVSDSRAATVTITLAPPELWSQNGLSGHKITKLSVSSGFAADATVYAATAGGGNFVSGDAGASWRSRESAIPEFPLQQTQFAISADGRKVLKSTDAGQNWSSVLTQTRTVFFKLLQSPGYETDHTVYVTADYDASGQIWRTTDGGTTWVQFGGPQMWSMTAPVLEISPGYATDKTVFVGIADWYRPFRVMTYVDGALKQQYEIPNTLGSVWLSFTVSPQFAVDHTVYACTSSGLYRSSDGGAGWSGTGIQAAALFVSPMYHVLLARTADGLLRSTDRGGTWTKAGFAADALFFAPDYGSRSLTLYALSNGSGLHKSVDGGISWSDENVGLTSLKLTTLAFAPDGATVFVGTENGVFNNAGVAAAVDRSAPVISAFSTVSFSSSLNVPITAFSAGDNVNGYCLQRTNSVAGCLWSSVPPASYLFSDLPIGLLGSRTLYAFARDISGNISDSRSSSVAIVAPLPAGDDFELANRGKLPWQGSWLFSKANGWDGTVPHGGDFVMKAPETGDSRSSSMQLTVPTEAGEFSFWVKVSAENNYDFLNFYIDGARQGSWTNEVPWTRVTYSIPSGTHTFRWSYAKDSSNAMNYDTAWVDDIVFPAAVADGTAPTVTAFGIAASSNAPTVPVTAFTATDNKGVAGFCLTETDQAGQCSWSSAKPASYTFSGVPEGAASSRTLFARVVDKSGNISASVSAVTSITLATRPTVTTTIPANAASAVAVADTVVSATFSEAMNPAATTSGRFTLSRWIGFKALAAGVGHTVALKGDGTVLAWGDNANGQAIVPAGLSGVISVAAGANHCVALKGDGSVIAWGDNSAGQRTVPEGLAGVVAIAAGKKHTVALKGDGTVVAWGDDSEGQMSVPSGLGGVAAIAAGGNNTAAVKSDGTVVQWGNNPDLVPSGLSGVVSVAAADHFTAVLKSDGTMAAWGYNDLGQANIPEGLSDVAAIAAGGSRVHAVKRDGSVESWGDTSFGLDAPPAGVSGVIAVAAGDSHSVALKADGTAIGWGANDKGQTSIPAGVSAVSAVAAGGFHSLAINGDGSVVAWGANGDGQATIPVPLAGVTAIAAGGYHSLALKDDGTVAAWGNNSMKQTELPAGLTGVTAIAAGGYHNLALTGGIVSAWGYNSHGQITIPPGLSGVAAVAAGYSHSLALKSDGSVAAWGYDGYGQVAVPPGLSGVIAIAAAGYHSLALKDNGTVTAWGSNSSGQTTVPAGLAGVVAIAAGSDHSVALKSDGTVVLWGGNYYGQRNLPPGLSGIVAIAAKDYYNLAVKSDGTVIAWGLNSSGQINVPILSEPVAGSISWEAALSARFTPSAPLAYGERYLASIVGRSAEGIPMAAPAAWRFTTFAPLPPVLTAKPAVLSNSKTATFAFSSNHPSAVFTCKLDDGDYAPCGTPYSYDNLADGSHSFTVQSKEQTGEPIATPTSFAWTIDTLAPDTGLPGTPANPTSSAAASFSFTSTEVGSTFQCSLDGGTFASCSSPKAYTNLTAGSHSFEVLATDAVGNSDLSAAAYNWSVDQTPPETTIGGKPSDPTAIAAATFSFTST